MKILVLNSGSSSVKYQVFEVDNEDRRLCKGLVDRIGLNDSTLTHIITGKEKFTLTKKIVDHRVAIEAILQLLTDPKHGVISDLHEIEGVGHRVVHGGEKFSESVLIDEPVLKAIEECCELAPLHNPPNLLGIKECQKLLPHVSQVAVFDTAFHHTMPPKAYAYAIPYDMYLKYGIRRYGFHGTSHKYVAHEAAKLLNKRIETLKIITCHLGNGCSMAAVKHGMSIDTSMGFTPLEGLVMGSRSGDIDPYVPLYIMERTGRSIDEMRAYLNKQSGLKGICSKMDMRDILADAAAGSEPARLAIEVFTYRVAKYIGAYAMAMSGVDVVVFTAGMGEKSAVIRKKALAYASHLGVEIDDTKNDKNEKIFSTPRSAVTAMTIPTNEELVIARDTFRLISEKKSTQCQT
jgi:acetate kinase